MSFWRFFYGFVMKICKELYILITYNEETFLQNQNSTYWIVRTSWCNRHCQVFESINTESLLGERNVCRLLGQTGKQYHLYRLFPRFWSRVRKIILSTTLYPNSGRWNTHFPVIYFDGMCFFLLLIVYCRVVFFKPMHVREYSSTDITDCLDGKCPVVSVQITGGDSTDSDCVSRAYPKYQQESSGASIVCIFLLIKYCVFVDLILSILVIVVNRPLKTNIL